jgi:DNA primase
LNLQPDIEARTLIGAAARRELKARSRLVDIAAIEEDRAARLDVEALNDLDRSRASAAAESLLGWLDRRSGERDRGG